MIAIYCRMVPGTGAGWEGLQRSGRAGWSLDGKLRYVQIGENEQGRRGLCISLRGDLGLEAPGWWNGGRRGHSSVWPLSVQC